MRIKDCLVVSHSFDTDSTPTWSEDGKKVAFLRFRSDEDAHGISGAYQQGPSFSVFVADVGAARRSSSDNANVNNKRFLGVSVREV